MTDLISARTRRAFQESYVGFSVLREIEADFSDAGVAYSDLPESHMVSGQRRSLVEGYYLAIDWSSRTDVRRVLDAYECHLFRLNQDHAGSAKEEAERLVENLEADGLCYRVRKIVLPQPDILDEDIVDTTLTVDVSQLRINITRIRNTVEVDPALAIGASKELVEACCKAVLVEMGETLDQSDDIPKLIKRAAGALDLLPEEVPERRRGIAAIRRVLGSLGNIVQGMAELRNEYGSGHGRGPGRSNLLPRHARLCAGAASTLSFFLMETARARRE